MPSRLFKTHKIIIINIFIIDIYTFSQTIFENVKKKVLNMYSGNYFCDGAKKVLNMYSGNYFCDGAKSIEHVLL